MKVRLDFFSSAPLTNMPKKDDDLVLLEVFKHQLDAHSARILLEANGIPCAVDGDTPIEGIESPRAYVHRKNLELARRVLAEVPAAAEILIPAWTCQCGEEVDEGFGVCWSCGHELAPDEADSNDNDQANS